MTLLTKTVYCSFCGRSLAELDLVLAENAHGQQLTFRMVCDVPCARGTENIYNQHDFIIEKPKQDLRCKRCGGSISSEAIGCVPCAMMEQYGEVTPEP